MGLHPPQVPCLVLCLLVGPACLHQPCQHANEACPAQSIYLTCRKGRVEANLEVSTNKALEIVPSTHTWNLAENGFDPSVRSTNVQYMTTAVR